MIKYQMVTMVLTIGLHLFQLAVNDMLHTVCFFYFYLGKFSYIMPIMEDWSWDELKPKKKKNKLQQRLEDEEEKNYKGAVTRAPLYHRYFEGYSESRVMKPGGKSKIVRQYVGSYYTRDCSDSMWVVWKLIYIFMFIAATFLYVLGMIRQVGANTVVYTALPGLVSAIPVVILFATLCSCSVTSRKLTKYGYSLYFKLIRWCLITAGIIAVYGICTIVFMFLNPALAGETVLSTVFAFCSALIYGAIAFIEHWTGYNETSDKETPGDDSVIIS